MHASAHACCCVHHFVFSLTAITQKMLGISCLLTSQAMNAQEARDMLQASQAKPQLVAQIVPSPITFTWDATVQQIIRDQKLGQLLYIEVRAQAGKGPQSEGSALTWRQDIDLSGLNVMKLGIFYEALQRYSPTPDLGVS